MVDTSMSGRVNDDPRKLSAMVARAGELAETHEVASVMVGLVTERGDSRFSEYIDYLQGVLRVEDAIFRMTRERAVVQLADCSVDQARNVLDRLASEFQAEFPSLSSLDCTRRFVEVKPGVEKPSVKDVLTQIFAPPMLH